MRVKESGKKLKTQHSINEDHGVWSHHFMANRWGKSGNNDRFSFLGLQNHCGGGSHIQSLQNDCSHEIKRRLLLGRKPMTNLDSVLKSRDITLPTKAHIVKVWMWELDQKEGWSQRTDAFKLWCWRKLLKVPWTWRRSNQSILKEINTEYSLEGLML